MKLRPVIACLVFLLALSLSVTDALAAKRLGSGRSIGRQRDPATMQAAPAPAPAAIPPSAAPASPLPSPGIGQPGRGFGPVPQPQRSSWLGPLAGFAGGALLGGLLFGHGGGGEAGGFGGLLIALLLIGGFIFLLRRFLAGAAGPARMAQTDAGGWVPVPANDTQGRAGVRQFGSVPSGPVPQAAGQLAGQFALPGELPPRPSAQLRLPPGFDLPAFLRESRLAFVRLQDANDRGDLADLREFTTPQMYAELSMQIQERGGVAQRVEVIALDAELLDLTVEPDEAVASVQFRGNLREDQGNPEPFSELWHVRKRLDQPNASWLLAGIQQLQ